MIHNPHFTIAEQFNVHPETAQTWIYKGLIGRRIPPDERKRGVGGRPVEYIVMEDDIRDFTPPPPRGRPKGFSDPALRCKVRLLALDGCSNGLIAATLKVPFTTVCRWCAGLEDRPKVRKHRVWKPGKRKRKPKPKRTPRPKLPKPKAVKPPKRPRRQHSTSLRKTMRVDMINAYRAMGVSWSEIARLLDMRPKLLKAYRESGLIDAG